MVFDDSAGDDPARGIIGVAFVPLADLARGVPVEGAFRLINPVTRQEAGQLVLGMGWHNPLRLPGEAPPSGERQVGSKWPIWSFPYLLFFWLCLR